MEQDGTGESHETTALMCEILALNAATHAGTDFVLLTVRLNPFSFQTTELLVPLTQARDRLQVDLADVLERSPVFKDLG
ncbi:hypothetical protein [Novipirellula artificiosorum]|uniref:hypothetical protein n=1 Tax=Novipirellula artificiosorum TaxID=2528016 RepID=UPI0011B44C3C|nr:hypothetical protein [Novipirellula artificiosorum]